MARKCKSSLCCARCPSPLFAIYIPLTTTQVRLRFEVCHYTCHRDPHRSNTPQMQRHCSVTTNTIVSFCCQIGSKFTGFLNSQNKKQCMYLSTVCGCVGLCFKLILYHFWIDNHICLRLTTVVYRLGRKPPFFLVVVFFVGSWQGCVCGLWFHNWGSMVLERVLSKRLDEALMGSACSDCSSCSSNNNQQQQQQ